MFQRFYEPDPILKGVVNNIMIDHVTVEPFETRSPFSIPPLPEHAIIFYLGDRPFSEDVVSKKKDRLSSCVIIGPQVVRHEISPGQNHFVIKVGFQPGGLAKFLRIPAYELLVQDHFDATDILGSEIHQVIEQLMENSTYLEKKEIVDKYLLQRIRPLGNRRYLDDVFANVIRCRGVVDIDKLIADACLSRRQFERLFREQIGLSPKYFSRLVRFGQAWILKQQKPGISWTEIAYESGYFDQMHLIRDFNEFAGVNPGAIEKELLGSPARFAVRFHQ